MCNFIIVLKGNSIALIMNKLRMNGVSQLDIFIKREEIKFMKRADVVNYVDVLVFQNKTLIDAPMVVIQRDIVLIVIKIFTRRSKTRLETLESHRNSHIHSIPHKTKQKKEVHLAKTESRKHSKQKNTFLK